MKYIIFWVSTHAFSVPCAYETPARTQDVKQCTKKEIVDEQKTFDTKPEALDFMNKLKAAKVNEYTFTKIKLDSVQVTPQ